MPKRPEAGGGRVLVFAPWGRDAESAGRLLSGRGIEPVPVWSVAELAGAIGDHAGAVLVTEEAFARQDLAPLFAALEDQPGWSDLPFVFLTARRTGRHRAAEVFTDTLRGRAVNVMTLERPLSRVSLFSALDWALAARRRQFQTRDQLGELERQAEQLRRGEERLRRAHDQLRLAQAGGGVGVFTLDVASGRMAVSPEFCRIFGVPPRDHYPAATFEAMTVPEDAALRSSPENRRDGTSALDVEYRIRRPDTGELRWIARRAEFTPGPDGLPLRMAGAVQDVTTRKEAEAGLRASERRFRSFAQSMPNQFWTATPDGRVDWANDRMLSYSGFSSEGLSGEGWADFVHPDDLSRVARDWGRAVASGNPYETESRLRRHDGAYRWHIGRALPERGPDGAVLRWVGTNTDIQDQKTAQALLADSNAALERRVAERTREFDQIWRLSHDLLAVLGEDRSLRAVNPAWTRVLGFETGELVGRSIDSLFEPESKPDGTPPPPGIVGRIRHKDGSDRSIVWMTARDEAGVFYGYGRDVTAETEAQAALRDTEERLRQSQKMEAVGQLTGGMAHDFNNLLQAMSGCLQLVGRRAGHVAGVEKVIDAGRQAVDRGASMIRQLMAFSRQQSLQPEAFDVRDRLLGMRSFLDRALRADLRLEFDLQGGLWPVLADPVQFELAVLNLATNARDALDKGGLIVIGAGNVEMKGNDGLNGSFVRVWVRDNGHGIAAAMVSRVFDPFFTTKAVGKGTGLGLAQVYGFCRQSGGTATVDSAEGRGTTVSLLLPRSAALGDAGTDRPPAAPPPEGNGVRVLMVEDDPVVAPVIMAALEDLGYRVSRASTGEEALQRLRRGEKADLLFTDVVMPGMIDGITLAKEVRQLRPDLPILVTTGYSEDLAATEGLHVLPKPYRIEDLASAVWRTLRQADGRDAP